MTSGVPAVRVLRDPRAAATVLHPVRLRILEHLAEPDSATGVARRLRLPRQRVNYHLRLLESRGLLRLVGERRVGNCTERLVQAVAQRFALSPRLLGRVAADRGDAPPDAAGRLLAAAARIEREVGGGEGDGPPPDAHALETELRLPAGATDAFFDELRRVVARWAERTADDGRAPARRLLVALHRRPSGHASLRDPQAPAAGTP